jgi:hypothetical protein
LLVAAGTTTSALADSFTSSAASAVSNSIGSISDSFTGSSASSDAKKAVADGNYRVLDVATLPERLTHLRLQLEAMVEDATAPTGTVKTTVTLDLPRAALGAQGLAVGDTVNVRNRVYGVEFARAQTAARAREAFFLVLNDEWHHDLAPRAVKL